MERHDLLWMHSRGKTFWSSVGCCWRGDWTVFLLEYLEGDGGVLDGYNDPAVVKVKDVMLLLKNLIWSNTKVSRVPFPDSEKQSVFSKCCWADRRQIDLQCRGRGGVNERWGSGRKTWRTCLHVFPQSEVMYISSLYSTSLEPRLPEGRRKTANCC